MSAPGQRLEASAIAPWILPLALLVAWEAGAQLGLLSTRFLPAPSRVVLAGWHLALTGELFRHVGVSFLRAALGFAIGGATGFCFGLLNGLSARAAITPPSATKINGVAVCTIAASAAITRRSGRAARTRATRAR